MVCTLDLWQKSAHLYIERVPKNGNGGNGEAAENGLNEMRKNEFTCGFLKDFMSTKQH